MTLLPIVERELRVAARRRLTHWARFGAALAALAVMFWILALQRGAGLGSPKETGKMLFVVLASMSFFFCLAFGGYATADCLSAERRRGTLGLLFLTDLNGYDVVLGKLAATSVGAVYALLALVPVLALPLLMGGVAKELVWGVAASLLNTLFFALTAGLFVSAVSRDERHAITGTLALIAGITGGLPLLGALLETWFEGQWRYGAAQALFVCSPAYGFFQGLNVLGMVGSAMPFWVSMAVTHGLAWLFLGLACVILPRTWREHGEGCARPGGWRERWRWWNPLRRWRKRPAGVLEDNPVTWLSCRRPGRLFGSWTVVVLMGAGWLIGLWTVGEDWLSPPAPVPFMLLLHGLLKYELAGEAGRRFAEDRQSGALELLLATPLTVPEILQGQRRALWRRFAGPMAAALVADGLLLAGGMDGAGMRSGGKETVALMLAGMVMLVVDAAALAWLGMWQGLTARNFTLAWVKTMFWVLWLPWVVFLVLSITAAASGEPSLNFGGAVMVWVIIGVVADAVALTLAHARLSDRFRDYAAGRFGGRAVAVKDGG